MNQHIVPPKVESDGIPSPALLFFNQRIRRNIDRTLTATGGPSRLRPHVKTHKCSQIVRMKISAGITKFKCATIAEADMLADAGAEDVLLAYQPVGPNIGLLLDLVDRYQGTRFSCIIDHEQALADLNSAAVKRNIRVPVFLDVDVGMARTGVHAAEKVRELARLADSSPATWLKGLHAYDGHNTESEHAAREKAAAATVETVRGLLSLLQSAGLEIEETVIGGTPMFTYYTGFPDLVLSPGTLFLHDYHSHARYSDLHYEFAAMILSRVVSLPEKDLFTIDAGVKAISVDYPEKAKLISLPDAEPGPLSEEHRVFSCPCSSQPKLGDPLLLVPGHVCTTVHCFDKAYVMDDDGRPVDTWQISARGRV